MIITVVVLLVGIVSFFTSVPFVGLKRILSLVTFIRMLHLAVCSPEWNQRCQCSPVMVSFLGSRSVSDERIAGLCILISWKAYVDI